MAFLLKKLLRSAKELNRTTIMREMKFFGEAKKCQRPSEICALTFKIEIRADLFLGGSLNQWKSSSLSFLRKYLPTKIPTKLQPRTSRRRLSHQHSKKFGTHCLSDLSYTSNAMLNIQVRQLFLKIIVLNSQPIRCATTKTSIADLILLK